MEKNKLPRFVKIEGGNCARFSNVMHMQYHRRLYDQVVAVDKEKLKLTDAVLAEWREAIDQEVELNKEATQSVHTARLVKLDAERDRLLTNFFGVIRIQKLSPVAAVQEAAQRVEVIFKPYAGIQNEALEAESGHIAGMFEDAKKCTADLTTLGLTAVLSQLRTVNAEFEQLGATRRHEAVEAKRPSATAIRPKTDEALEFVVQHIQGSYLFSTVEADPETLAALHARRASLRQLMEGRAADISGLLEWEKEARARLQALTGEDDDPESLERALAQAQTAVLEWGDRLAASRRQLGAELSAKVTSELHALSMPDANFTVSWEEHSPSSTGLEDPVMLLQPHPQAPPRPLGVGASGGELSRVMLALEVLLGESDSDVTFVFDEVDSGIGGKTAVEVGARLARLAEHHQVVVVTHLAQVAAYADHHLLIEKNDGRTSIRVLEGEERAGELARMMSGDAHSEAARRHAYELLGLDMPQSEA